MKINEPIGPAVVSPLFLRLPLGAYFLLAGWSKFPVLRAFIDQVESFNVLPHNVAVVYGTLLPYVEVFIGILLLAGLWTTLAGIMAALLLLSFVVAFGLFPEGHRIFNKDLILFGVACALLYSGPGPYSMDKARSPGPT